MDYVTALAYLDGHIGLGVKPGLERIEALLDMMGHPELGAPIIHVAGTNGKTSTSRLASLVTVAHGLTTGTFTSPHLERVEERIAVNGRALTGEEFAGALTDAAAFGDLFETRTGDGLTYFELLTAAAFAWFAEQAVDVSVIEVGLGGRLDATNAAHGAVAVVTGIGLEHTEYLGTTFSAIAGEKLGIVEPGTVLVTGPLPDEAATVSRQVAGERGADLFRYGHEFSVVEATRGSGGWELEIEGVFGTYTDVFLPLHGRHQTINLAVAVAAVEGLFGRRLDEDAVIEAATVATTPGRMEAVATRPLLLLDGAHNPDGFRVLAAALEEEYPATRWVLVLGIMEDKDLAAMIPVLADRLHAVVATSIESARAVPAGVLAERVQALCDVPVEPVTPLARALERAGELGGDDGAVLVAGSLYLVGAARSIALGTGAVQPGER